MSRFKYCGWEGQAYDWVGELAQKLRQKNVTFCNFGVGADLAYNALQRITRVVDVQPDKVVVLVGGNDVLALVSKKAKRFYPIFKRLPRNPSAEWYRENMVAIARALKRGTEAPVGFCSLTPIGENLDAHEPLQQELNRHLEEYSEIVRDVAEREDLRYLPVFERLCREIAASPGPAFLSLRLLPMYRDAFRALILRQTPDEIAKKNGWRIHTDGVHLNS